VYLACFWVEAERARLRVFQNPYFRAVRGGESVCRLPQFAIDELPDRLQGWASGVVNEEGLIGVQALPCAGSSEQGLELEPGQHPLGQFRDRLRLIPARF
jgi:hypothetical protein